MKCSAISLAVLTIKLKHARESWQMIQQVKAPAAKLKFNPWDHVAEEENTPWSPLTSTQVPCTHAPSHTK